VTTIETARLTLDRLTEGDVEALLDYRNDPEVARYQSWERFTPEQANEMLLSQRSLDPGTPGHWTQFAARLRNDGALIGDLGLFVDGDDPRLGEIGFTFGRQHQGKGFAGEATAALLDFAFGVLRLHRIRAIVDCRNFPAQRMLERSGFRREGHFLQHAWFKGAWCDEFLYAMLAAEWRSAADRNRGPRS
jgi:RimJ/RimL family protein N-acetyltransferase